MKTLLSIFIIYSVFLLISVVPLIGLAMEIYRADSISPGPSSCTPVPPSENYGELCVRRYGGFRQWGWIVYNLEPDVTRTGYCQDSCTSGCDADWYRGGCYTGTDAGMGYRTYDYDVDPTYNGKSCKVYDSWGNVNTDGKWDYNDKSVDPLPCPDVAGCHGCIVCHATDPVQVAIDFAGDKYTGQQHCEEICGADPECDEVEYASGVDVPGGVCNFCIFSLGGCDLNRVGDYTIDFHCILEGSHHLQSGNLYIVTGGILQLNPGSSLQFDSGHSIQLSGDGYILISDTAQITQ